MTAQDVFRRMAGALDRSGIAFMVTGSFASSYHGAPRATQDIDLVISATEDQLRSLAAQLPASEYYVHLDAALKAKRREAMFNIVDLATGWKIDFIFRKSRQFSLAEFERRTIVEFEGMHLPIATAEDVLIAKLEWAKAGESQRQIEDAAGILRVRSGNLDEAYIERWVQQLGLEKQWADARRVQAGGGS